MKLKPDSKLLKKKTKKKFGSNAIVGAKRCRFCHDKDLKSNLDYKNTSLLKGFLTDCGKIVSARSFGTCHACQKKLSNAIKLSRTMALIPFCAH